MLLDTVEELEGLLWMQWMLSHDILVMSRRISYQKACPTGLLLDRRSGRGRQKLEGQVSDMGLNVTQKWPDAWQRAFSG